MNPKKRVFFFTSNILCLTSDTFKIKRVTVIEHVLLKFPDQISYEFVKFVAKKMAPKKFGMVEFHRGNCEIGAKHFASCNSVTINVFADTLCLNGHF